MTMENDNLAEEPPLEEQLANGDEEVPDEFENDSEIGGHDDDASESDTPAGVHEAAEWVGLSNHAQPTATRIIHALQRLAGRGKTSITVLVLGRAGMGKSTTINSLFASDVVDIPPYIELSPERPHPLVVRKRAAGVSLIVVDAQGLVESDAVSVTGLKRIAFYTKNQPVDAMMFIDRMDIPRPDELDYQIMTGLTSIFGQGIWPRMIIGLTRADVRHLMPGDTYNGLIDKRVHGIRSIMKKAGARNAALPFVLIENGEQCQRNEHGEKVLQNGDVWIPQMVETVVDVALKFPSSYKYNPKRVHSRANFIAKYCLIPLVLLAQCLFKVIFLDPLIREDGLKGDRDGPYDPEQIERARARGRARDEAEKKRKEMKENAKRRHKKETTLEEEMSGDSEDEFYDTET